MKVIACLSWYDESPAFLAAAIASVAPFCGHLVAADGAYLLFPGACAHSPTSQAATILDACRAAGLGVTLHEPAGPWLGCETEKRTHLFELAAAVADPDDWYYVVDADEVVTETGCDIQARLARTDLDAGEVTLWQHRGHQPADPATAFATPLVQEHRIRKFFRAIPGLHVAGTHFTYRTPDGRLLWGDDGLEPAEDLTAVRVEHRNGMRDRWRAEQSLAYYKRRDELGIEGAPHG